MKNKEKFIDEILKVALEANVLAIKNGIPVSCVDTGCKNVTCMKTVEIAKI